MLVQETAALMDPVIRAFYGRVEARHAISVMVGDLFRFISPIARLKHGSPMSIEWWSTQLSLLIMSQIGIGVFTDKERCSF